MSVNLHPSRRGRAGTRDWNIGPDCHILYVQSWSLVASKTTHLQCGPPAVPWQGTYHRAVLSPNMHNRPSWGMSVGRYSSHSTLALQSRLLHALLLHPTGSTRAAPRLRLSLPSHGSSGLRVRLFLFTFEYKLAYGLRVRSVRIPSLPPHPQHHRTHKGWPHLDLQCSRGDLHSCQRRPERCHGYPCHGVQDFSATHAATACLQPVVSPSAATPCPPWIPCRLNSTVICRI